MHKIIWLAQAKQLIKIFECDLENFVNTLVRIKLPQVSKSVFYSELEIDFAMMDKLLTHMVGISKEHLKLMLNTEVYPGN